MTGWRRSSLSAAKSIAALLKNQESSMKITVLSVCEAESMQEARQTFIHHWILQATKDEKANAVLLCMA